MTCPDAPDNMIAAGTGSFSATLGRRRTLDFGITKPADVNLVSRPESEVSFAVASKRWLSVVN
jgi:hypothetical protein